MKKIDTIQVISIEDFPDEFEDEIWEQLPNNGGNVICFDKDSKVGKWLESQGYIFKDQYASIVVYR